MLEDYEDIELRTSVERTDELTRLSESQMAYLSEISVPSSEWAEMTDGQKSWHLDVLQDRLDELGIKDIDVLENTDLLPPEILDELNIRLEAPNDMIQIEQVSDALACCEEIRFENWQNLELNEKVEVLNRLETQIASIEHRPSCPIRAVNLHSGCWGGYNPATKSIEINAAYMEESGYSRYHYDEIVDTLVHEGRHAYQDYNVNVCEVHPRHAEVKSWAETMEGGKWGYSPIRMGQRLYEQQSVEIDARNFAADVLARFKEKIA